MSIPPSLPPSSNFPPQQHFDQCVAKFNQLWNTWYENPSRETGQALLDFLSDGKNQAHFRDLAKAFPAPPHPRPSVDFEHSLKAAQNYLQGWIKDGCDPSIKTSVSEWVADVAKWVNYAR